MGRPREKRSQSNAAAAAAANTVASAGSDAAAAITGNSTGKTKTRNSSLTTPSSSYSAAAAASSSSPNKSSSISSFFNMRLPSAITSMSYPRPLRFPTAVILSFALSASMYSFAADATDYELAGVSRRIDETWQVGGLLGWKVVELAVAWFRDYDDIDLRSLTILSHTPYFFLLNQCYDIRLKTCALCLGIDVLATTLPFRLLRKRASTHRPLGSSGSRSSQVSAATAQANRAVVHDNTVRLSTWSLATCIYATVILLSSRTWLPSFLVVHFEGLRSLARLHATEIPRLLLFTAPLGYAMQDFVFTAVTATTAQVAGKSGGSADSSSSSATAFDPVSASLSETFWYNVLFWHRWDRRMKVLVERMVTVGLVTLANTSVQTFNTLEGADMLGALGWASMWAMGNVVVSCVYGWVGDV